MILLIVVHWLGQGSRDEPRPASPSGDPLQIGLEQRTGLAVAFPNDRPNSGLPQACNPAAGYFGIGVGDGHVDLRDPCVQDGVDAGRSPAVVAAGLKRDVEDGAGSRVTRLAQRDDLGMGLAGDGLMIFRWQPDPEEDPEGVTAKVIRTGTTTTYEVAIEWSVLGEFQPKHGAAIGMALMVNDSDDGEAASISWEGTACDIQRLHRVTFELPDPPKARGEDVEAEVDR